MRNPIFFGETSMCMVYLAVVWYANIPSKGERGQELPRVATKRIVVININHSHAALVSTAGWPHHVSASRAHHHTCVSMASPFSRQQQETGVYVSISVTSQRIWIITVPSWWQPPEITWVKNLSSGDISWFINVSFFVWATSATSNINHGDKQLSKNNGVPLTT